jgi:hypothetical protein
MKSLSVLLVLLVFTGCALQRKKSVEHEAVAKPVVVKEEKSKVLLTKGAVWGLFGPEQITLQFKNVDNGTNLSVVIEEGVTVHPVTPGHYELTGYEQNGKSYTSMNISKKFVMRIKSNSLTYAGTILTGCPKIESKDFTLLKGMRFFNRYPFSGGTGLCEMVVGNDLASVRVHLKKERKSKKLNLVMGF